MENENLERDIEAIEEEKKEFLEGKDVDSESEDKNDEEVETEVMEFSLIDEEIDELIAKLQLLKESKESINFDVDDENELVIHYDEDGAPLGVPQDTELGGKEEE